MAIHPAIVLVIAATLGPRTTAAQNLFPRGVYWPQERLAWMAQKCGMDRWEYADQLLGKLHDAHHCNFIWVVNIGTDDLKRLCKLAKQHDIEVAGVVEPVLWWRQHRTPEYAVKCAKETTNRLATTDGLYAYVLIDEPRTWELSYLDAVRHELALLDPGRPTLTVTMRGDTPAAIHRTGFSIITSDIYPFFFNGDPNGPNPPRISRAYYRLCTESFGRQCQSAGKTFWIMPQAFMEVWGDWYYDGEMNVVAQPGAYLHWRMPTVGETRWQIWQGLAGGAKGVVFFVLFPPKNERTPESPPGAPAKHPYPKIADTLDTGQPAALLHPDSTPTAQMTAMGQAFADIERLTPLLQRLHQCPFPVLFAQPPFHCQTLQDDRGNLYAIVINDDTDRTQVGEIIILPGIDGVRELRSQTQLSLAAAEKSPLQRLALELPAGDGVVLQLSADPSRRPLATVVEDFSVPLVTGKFDNAQVRVRRLPWGVGWQYEMVQSEKGEDAPPATLTCAISTLTGDPKAHRPSGPIYVVYQGRTASPGEGIQLSFSSDDKEFRPSSADEFGQPIPIPRAAASLRFTVAKGAGLTDFYVIATEIAR